ncbi:MAG: aldehyde dehydrogenase family protein [Proteobacteria bacterium]|nr:aldehyde dehydrogenase family protein [Pseudomonadota bacterium]
MADRDRLLRRGDYIWGSFIKPERVDGYVVGVNPGDRMDVLGRFPFSEGSVDDAVSSAMRGFVLWRQCSLSQRVQAVRRYREGLSKYQAHFARLISREIGKPLWEARQEVLQSLRAVDLILEDGLALLESRVLDENEARSDYIPRGVVGILTPYNSPLYVPTLHVIASLVAGNTVVFKPSKFAPAVGQGVAELIDRCKLPRGVFNLVQGSGGTIGQRLATHPGVDALLFTGSFPTAMAIRRATFERPELPSLYQCGGKGCAIVTDSAEVERAVYETLVGAFKSSGQRFNSTGRVIVTTEIFDRFVEELCKRAAKIRLDYPANPDAFMGPLISENLRTRYRRYGRALMQRGHTQLLDLGTPEVSGHRGFYANPAIYWVNWQNGHAFLNEEPPGPNLLVYRVENWEEAVALHNQLVYRTSAAVFADANDPALSEIVHRLKTGAVNVNRGTIGSSMRLPSVGLGRASNGIPGGLELLKFLSTPRAKLVESRPFDPMATAPGMQWVELEEEDAIQTIAPEMG